MTDPHRAARSLAMDAVIVMLSPGKGKLWSHANWVTAGAILAELTWKGRLHVSGEGDRLEVTVHDSTPLGDELLDDALQVIASGEHGHRVKKLVPVLPSAERAADLLVADGLVVDESYRKFGLRSVQQHRPTPAAGRDELMVSIMSALGGKSTPDDRLSLLISVIDIGPYLRFMVPDKHADKVVHRAGEIREEIGSDERAIISLLDEELVRVRNTSDHII